MFSPTLWLAGLVLLAVACGGSYLKGYKNAENAAKAAYAQALEKSIAQARQTAIEDMQLEAESQKQRTITKIEYRDRIVKVREAINNDPLPANCVIPEPRRLLVIDAINSANSKIAAKP